MGEGYRGGLTWGPRSVEGTNAGLAWLRSTRCPTGGARSIPDPNDFNAHTIEEFRANDGEVGGYFEGATMLLLHTKGAQSRLPRTNPLVYLPDGDRYVVVASKGGAHTHPDWYYNLLADPNAEIEVGIQRFPVRATVITGPERDELYARQVERRPGFADYEKKTTRTIPVIALEPVPLANG